METIQGKKSFEVDFNRLAGTLTTYNRIILDLGTGDGRYARSLADQHPDWFILGVDSCRENLREHSRAKLQNLLFVIASAQDLPREWNGFISHITINFPWGSLLESLLAGDPMLMRGLETLAGAAASFDLHLNGGALNEAGSTLEAGGEIIYNNLLQAGWQVTTPVMLDATTLRNFPSTWGRRLAFGRDPRALKLSGQK